MRWTLAIAAALSGLTVAAAPAAAAAVKPPVLAAAGDIACPPGTPPTTAPLECQQQATADLITSRAPDAVAALGDNQYDSGSLAEFLGSFDHSWGAFKPLVRPVTGNHEYRTDAGAGGYFAYFGAAAGSAPDGFYSWNLGDWHLIALNSDCGDAGCGTAADVSARQQTWLEDDLDAHSGACTLAYWHHPLFGDGNGGDNPEVKPLWDALYSRGADIVLNGHDHSYQRWAQQTPGGAANPRGLTQIIVGTGGDDLLALSRKRANDTFRDNTHMGVLFLTLSPSRADWEWRGTDGTVLDSGGAWCHRPEAAATITTPDPTAGAPVSFDAGGSVDHYGETLTDVAWSFGDGDAGTGPQATHTYATAGTYPVTLTVTNARGLTGRVRTAVTVAPAPVVPPLGPGATPGPGSDAPADAGSTPAAGPVADPPPAASALLAPLRIFEAGMTRRSFRRGTGTAFRYRLSADARVTIVVQRRRGARWTRVESFARSVRRGRVRAAFDGRVGGRLLAAGAYRARLRATAPDGRRSALVTVAFRIASR